ncbi:MAG TPA: GH3 auxin-responsive promoter family protein [Alphaproteobacteria bacterium]|nr:GH3 auxin-responsive promoter family protein [Alphaproteobacteria bacterium]
MAMTFAEQQENALRRIVKANGRSSLYAHMGLQKLNSYRDFNLLYQSFTRAVPVQSGKGWLDGLSKILQPPGQAYPLVLQSPGLITKTRIEKTVPWKNLPLPWGNPLGDDLLAAEAHMKSLMQAQGLQLDGAFFYLGDNEAGHRGPGLPMVGLNTALDAQRNWFRRRWVLPRADTLAAAGGSRFAWFAAMLDQLRQVGNEVSALVTTPKTLIDFGLYVSQQEGKFTPLAKLVPNLQAILFNHYEVALQRTEIGYLLAGLERVKWLQYLWQPTGFVACQYDINIRQRLQMIGDGQAFYEFIPAGDVTSDGKLTRNFRRLHAGQVEPGQEYMPVLTTASGLLGVASGQLIKVLQTDPMHVSCRGPAMRLDGLGEGIREDAVVEALANINMALGNHGVFVRDALLGHRVAERQPVWVLEISRPMGEVPQPVLESLARRLHGEMELRFESYRKVFRVGSVKPPQVHLVPLGSFAAAQTGPVDSGLFDHSEDAALVRKVLKAAWESLVVSAA